MILYREDLSKAVYSNSPGRFSYAASNSKLKIMITCDDLYSNQPFI